MKKWIITTLCILSTCLASAQTQVNLVHNMFHYFNQLNQKNLTLKDIESFYTPDVLMITNDQLIAKGYSAFFKHFQEMMQHADHFHFVSEEDFVINDQVISKYKIKMPSGTIHVMAIFHFKDNKIDRWDEVACTSLFPKQTVIKKIKTTQRNHQVSEHQNPNTLKAHQAS